MPFLWSKLSVHQRIDWRLPHTHADSRGRRCFSPAKRTMSELHRRLAAIVERRSLAFREFDAFRLLDMPGEDVTLGKLVDGTIRPTPLLSRLEQACDIVQSCL
jgi:hypothetical protein